jgi:hypothetical protein
VKTGTLFLTLLLISVDQPLLFNFAFECVITKVQENEEGLELNGTHHFLIYANVNMLVENINTVKMIPQALLETGGVVGREVNTEKTKYMVVSRH